MIMGFSPTVWASGYRTFCILFISMIITTLIIINENIQLFTKNNKKLLDSSSYKEKIKINSF